MQRGISEWVWGDGSRGDGSRGDANFGESDLGDRTSGIDSSLEGGTLGVYFAL